MSFLSKLPSIRRPRDFFGPEDGYSRSTWQEAEKVIIQRQKEWDEAYSSLTVWERFRYQLGWY